MQNVIKIMLHLHIYRLPLKELIWMELDTHLFSAASMLMASMMLLTFSVICLALIVCCSNFVFTADCEIHSCEAITHKLL